jgi:hypothetical protein
MSYNGIVKEREKKMVVAKLYRVGGWDTTLGKRVLNPVNKTRMFKNRQQVDSENKKINIVGGKGALVWVPVKDLEGFEVR